MQKLAESVETLFIQQAEGPAGPASQLATALRLSRGEAISILGNDHLYTGTVALGAILREWKKNLP